MTWPTIVYAPSNGNAYTDYSTVRSDLVDRTDHIHTQLVDGTVSLYNASDRERSIYIAGSMIPRLAYKYEGVSQLPKDSFISASHTLGSAHTSSVYDYTTYSSTIIPRSDYSVISSVSPSLSGDVIISYKAVITAPVIVKVVVSYGTIHGVYDYYTQDGDITLVVHRDMLLGSASCACVLYMMAASSDTTTIESCITIIEQQEV